MFKQYALFDIQMSARRGQEYVLSARGPGGDASDNFVIPTIDPSYRALADRLERLDVDENLLSTLGQQLFHSLFPGPIKEIYTRTQGGMNEGHALRIRLNMTPDQAEIAALPWEFLYDPDQGPLVLLDAPIVRYLPQSSRVPMLPIRLPLKVLLTGAQTAPGLEVERELHDAMTGLTGLRENVLVVHEPHLTTAKLQRLLRQGFHVWHFVGQSAMSSDGTTAVLQFEDDSGNPKPVSSRELGVLLNRTGVRLIVLDTCNSPRLVMNAFASVAPALIRAQVAAVVTLQSTSTPEATRDFVGEFYRTLAEGFPIDACVTEGRKAIMNVTGLGHADWGLPLVYTRAPDGMLFELPDSNGTAPESQLNRRLVGIQTAIDTCRKDLQAARRRINVMSKYKDLHDRFQQLDSSYLVIARNSKQVPVDPAAPNYQVAWDYLANEARTFQEAADKVLDCANDPSLNEREALWTKRLERCQREFDVAIRNQNAGEFAGVMRLIDELLSREISQISARLVVAASELRAQDLVETLKNVQLRLDTIQLEPSEAHQVEALRHATENLARMSERLDTLISNQDYFQQIEDELRLVESSLDQDLRELEITWRNLKPIMDALCRDSQATLAQRLSELSGRLEGTLVEVAHDPVRVKEAFRDYRSQVNRSFNRVDWDLRSLCGMLMRAGDDLAPMLGIIA